MKKACFSNRGPRPSHALAAVGIALGALAMAGTAQAEEPTKAELAKARTAFQEGVALAAANNCASALVKYKEVAQVKMTAHVAFNIAECEERLGKLMQALGNYRLAASQAGDDKNAQKVLREAGSRVDALDARIPKLTITRAKGTDGAQILLDGTEIGQSQLGKPIPVDPGPHTVVARFEGKEYLHESVTLAEKENRTFDAKFDLPKTKVEVAPVDPPKDEAPPPAAKSRVPGIVVTTVGGVALVTGLAMLGPRGSAISDLEAVCKDGRCPASAESTASRGKLFTGLTEVLVPVGVIGAAVGIYLIATSGPQKADAAKDKDKGTSALKIELIPAAPGATIAGASLLGKF